MNAHELRIGNYILKNDKLHYCSWMTIRDIKTQSIEEDDKFEPIPLTDEWLLKFGFEKIKSEYDVAECFDFLNGILYLDMANQICYLLSSEFGINCPESVHQLQNLYFALTGEELTIKN